MNGTQVSTAAPPGWYSDPWVQAPYRWWDGTGWSTYLSGWQAPQTAGQPVFTGATAVFPYPGSETRPVALEAPEPTLPLVAGLRGLGLLFGLLLLLGIVLPLVVFGLDDAGIEVPTSVLVLVGSALLYGPLVYWVRYSSRRWGSGSLRRDIGLEWRRMDLAWAVAAIMGAWVAQFTVIFAVSLLGLPLGSNTEGLGDGVGGVFEVLVLYATAAVLAPVVEEMFFRGLLLRSFRSRLAVVPVLLLQGFLFGLAHFSLGLGMGAVSLVLALSAVGIMYGLVSWHTRRLGSVIIAHAIQNAVAVTLALYVVF